jgi:molybdopterin-binding protein
MQISARNTLAGTVKAIVHGAVNSEVTIELPGGQQIVSVITKRSAEQLGLAPGKAVLAVIKASNVMIAVE